MAGNTNWLLPSISWLLIAESKNKIPILSSWEAGSLALMAISIIIFPESYPL